jgi:hypothetical protein
MMKLVNILERKYSNKFSQFILYVFLFIKNRMGFKFSGLEETRVFASLAQLVERWFCKPEVIGSTPLGGSITNQKVKDSNFKTDI